MVRQCPQCRTSIPDPGGFCPVCGAAMDSSQAPARPEPQPAARVDSPRPALSRTNVFIAVGVAISLLFTVVIWACSAVIDGGSRTDTPAFTMTANELSGEYALNEIAADQTYEGKTVRITGTVGSINGLSETVELDAMDGLSDVLCYMETDALDEVAAMSVGDEVTITGVCNGKLGWILVEDCVVE